MVGVVLVSHSQKAAEGAAELALMMAPDAPVKAAGGLEDGSLGTSFEKSVPLLRRQIKAMG